MTHIDSRSRKEFPYCFFKVICQISRFHRLKSRLGSNLRSQGRVAATKSLRFALFYLMHKCDVFNNDLCKSFIKHEINKITATSFWEGVTKVLKAIFSVSDISEAIYIIKHNWCPYWNVKTAATIWVVVSKALNAIFLNGSSAHKLYLLNPLNHIHN